jgi:hypothetical protein
MNLYELNKSIVNQLTSMTKEDLENKYQLLNDFLDQTTDNYYMLLCKEYNYYTIFAFKDDPEYNNFEKTVIEILDEVGEIYSIELTEDKSAIEIWIKPDGEESALVFYLFPYEAGVVYYYG